MHKGCGKSSLSVLACAALLCAGNRADTGKLLLAGGVGTIEGEVGGSAGLDATLDALGGDENRDRMQQEFSVACLVSKNVAVGAEYRFMRNRLEAAGRAAGSKRAGPVACHDSDWRHWPNAAA
jgi:hypothetical protein